MHAHFSFFLCVGDVRMIYNISKKAIEKEEETKPKEWMYIHSTKHLVTLQLLFNP